MNDLNARTYFATVILFAVFLGVFQLMKTKFIPFTDEMSQKSCQSLALIRGDIDQAYLNQKNTAKSVVAYWPARSIPLKEIKIYSLPFNTSLDEKLSVRSLMNHTHSFEVRLDHPKSLGRFQESISTLRVSRESESLDFRVACLLVYRDGSKEILGMDREGNIFLSGIKFERSESMYHLLTTWIPASYYK